MLSSSLRVAEVVSALSQALDLGAGSRAWHSVRTCILGMRLAGELRLSEPIQNELYYALLLKDAGLSGNISQFLGGVYRDETHAAGALTRSLGSSDIALQLAGPARWEANKLRSERGDALVRIMGLPEQTAIGIGSLYEQWDGRGNASGMDGERIPVISRIMLVAQTLDVFFLTVGPEAAISAIAQQSRRRFDPEVVRAARSLHRQGKLWANLTSGNLPHLALEMEPDRKTMAAGPVTLDAICRAFAAIVDAKSPFTCNHSSGVANVAVAIARKLEMSRSRVLFVRHAALLHDVGKMAVSNAILQKPGQLTSSEWEEMRSHPEHTRRILRSIRGFEEMSEVAAAHHERLDGSGYCRGLTAAQLSLEARILAIADIFDALSAQRPYREALPLEQVFAILRKSSPHALDRTCLEALEQTGLSFDQTFQDVEALRDSPLQIRAAAAGETCEYP